VSDGLDRAWVTKAVCGKF